MGRSSVETAETEEKAGRQQKEKKKKEKAGHPETKGKAAATTHATRNNGRTGLIVEGWD